MKLTPQQSALRDHAVAGDHIKAEAGAGSGKTFTLTVTAQAMLDAGTVRNGLYVGFNKITADEAKTKFPARFDCRTGHSLAYRTHGVKLKDKLPGRSSKRRKLSAIDSAKALRLDAAELDGVDGNDGRWLQPDTLYVLAMAAVERFCRSDRDELGFRDVSSRLVPTGVDKRQFTDAVLDAAGRLWADLIDPKGAIQTPHDVYRKTWALSRPNLRVGALMLDEAQDTAPVLAKVVQDQKAFGTQLIAVGDSCQQLYAWAGAVDALAKWDPSAVSLTLPHSFRFGPAIAAEANKWLTALGRPLRLIGWDALDSRVDDDADPSTADAVLCRTNVGALGAVITAQADGKRVALVGGGREVEEIAKAALTLMAGRRTDHPELCIFNSWEEVVKTVKADESSPLRPLVGMVQAYGPNALISAVRSLVAEQYADVVVSTGHKAKGREWKTVLVSEDFAPRKGDDEDEDATWKAEDMMLNYVTVTRASHTLIRGPLAAIDDMTPALL